ncbi:retrotransposon protein, putative, ty1-copia subclass, partial [Tanacetum coccineum]
YRNLRIVLRNEQKLHHLEEALPGVPPATATAIVRNAYTCRVVEQQEVACLMLHLCAEDEILLGLDGASWLSHASSPWGEHDSYFTLKGLRPKKGIPKKNPTVLAIRQGQIHKPKSQARGKGKQRGKGKSMLAYDSKHKIPPPAKNEHPAKYTECHHCHKTGYWKRNCPLYLAELKKNKASASGTSGIFMIELFSFPKSNTWIYDTGCGTHICNKIQGLRGYRKLNKGALDLYVGNGNTAPVKAIGSFDLILPSGMILVFDEEIKENGFTQNPYESCVHKRASGSIIVFLILYVNDILLMGNNIPILQDVKSWLGKCFAIKDLAEAAYILGIKIYRDRSRRLIGLSQNAYIDKILQQFKMDTSKRGTIPIQPNVDLRKSQGPSTPAKVKRMKGIPYASAVGFIMYNVRCTRPDVAFSQNLTSRYQHNSGESHWTAVKNILKYLRNTKDMFLVYGSYSTTKLGVTCYTDASAIDWKSSKQSTTAMSSMEAEYIAAAEAAMEAIWIRKFIFGLGIVPSIDKPMDMYCDNTCAITIADEPGVQKGAKHFRRKYHFIREVIQEACGSPNHNTTDHYDIEWFKRGKALQAKKAEALKSTRCDIRKPIWYLDNGCSRNMTGVKSYMHKYMEQPGPKNLFGDDSTCTTKVMAHIKLNGDVYVLDMTSSAQESCFFAKASENLNWL